MSGSPMSGGGVSGGVGVLGGEGSVLDSPVPGVVVAALGWRGGVTCMGG